MPPGLVADVESGLLLLTSHVLVPVPSLVFAAGLDTARLAGDQLAPLDDGVVGPVQALAMPEVLILVGVVRRLAAEGRSATRCSTRKMRMC